MAWPDEQALVHDHVEPNARHLGFQLAQRAAHLAGGDDRVGVGGPLHQQKQRFLAVEAHQPATLGHARPHLGHVGQPQRRPSCVAHDRFGHVGRLGERPADLDGVAERTPTDQSTRQRDVGRPQALLDLRHGEPVPNQSLRVEPHLDLGLVAAGDAHAGHALELLQSARDHIAGQSLERDQILKAFSGGRASDRIARQGLAKRQQHDGSVARVEPEHYRTLGLVGQRVAELVELLPDVQQRQVQIRVPPEAKHDQAAAQQAAARHRHDPFHAGHRRLHAFGHGPLHAFGRHVGIGRPDR